MSQSKPPPTNIVPFPRSRRACTGCGIRFVPLRPYHRLCVRCHNTSEYAAAIARYLAGETGDDDRR